jgi:hypothetical protein
MIELIANLIVVAALGGACLIVVFVVVKALISLAATRSSKGSVSVVVSEKVCRYCGAVLTGSKCDYCGAVNQARKKTRP